MSIDPGHYIGVFHYLTSPWKPGQLQYLNANLRYILQFKDEYGTIQGVANGPVVLGGHSNGKWKTVSFEFDVHSHYGGVKLASATLLLNIQNFHTGEVVYLDDIELIRKD